MGLVMGWSFFVHAWQPLAPHDLWTAWTVEPSLLVPLAATAFIYLWGIRNAWRSAGAGHGITGRSVLYFLGALLALIAALVSPLDALSGALLSAHMAQHLILILAAAPLLVMSDFPLALLWALPRSWAQSVGRRLNKTQTAVRAWQRVSSPVSAWLLFTIALWLWHTSTLYEAALRDETIHAIEHLCFITTAMLFWWVLLKPGAARRGSKDIHYGIAVPYLFATTLQSGVFGALMTFTGQPWYTYYAPLTATWGLTPMQDQQLAGLIMWFPGGAVFSLMTIGYFAAWFHALEERSARLPARHERK